MGLLALMAVEPRHRGTGVGSSLPEKLSVEFKKAGADIILLDCPSEAVEAQELYERMGFQVRARRMWKRF